MILNEQQIDRYSRQIILPHVGGKGQDKILNAKVLIVGTGGLGAPCAFYLAAAGIGKIGLVDSDKVELNNLQRQILHTTADVGIPKAESGKKRITALNPDINVVTHNLRLTSQNALELIKNYDIVVDGTDNFPTRFLINDACVMGGRPLVHAGIFRFDGQIMTIMPKSGPCYRCLFPEPPPPGLVPSCQEGGILGAVAGILGVLQANEVLKFVLGIGDLLIGKLLIFDALSSSFRTVKVPRDNECAVCSDHATITELLDYQQQACQIRRDEK
ncbi:MAG: adenylyltransferase [Candidatus Omnitrophica bacterium CG11_big_fil_rev_8_21_14_0_20_42_13]|uniref:Molybdopterin-synthase adenylyltransferase n=1 Tax=Candidatus Ghiorseimicrobium undicola TaxID=1974746 RepID=A0A2H0LXY3_9BACT|nr:MAG: adenylyltransferase [Candidatus Omnitrophica bacterium CG11_big_fil_rev_8_21_14_0_20_42_13]